MQHADAHREDGDRPERDPADEEAVVRLLQSPAGSAAFDLPNVAMAVPASEDMSTIAAPMIMPSAQMNAIWERVVRPGGTAS